MKTKYKILGATLAGLLAGAPMLAWPGLAAGQSSSPPPAGKTGGQASQGQAGAPASAAPAGPSADEQQAYQAISQELSAGLDLDHVIQLSEDFAKKYPASPMLSYVYTFEATAYQQKGEVQNVVQACEKSIKLNPDNLVSLILLATMLPQPQDMQGSDLDKQKKLTEAETYANHSLDLIAKLQKMPAETDDQFKKRTNTLLSEPHSALGLIHLQRATMTLTGDMDKDELAKSAAEFKQSVDLSDQPQPQDYYRLGEVYSHQDKIDDAIAAFSKASELGQGTGIQQIADQQIEALKKRQAQAKPPAAPAPAKPPAAH
jgi:tetratricopeptide (TPR) repeat protein